MSYVNEFCGWKVGDVVQLKQGASYGAPFHKIRKWFGHEPRKIYAIFVHSFPNKEFSFKFHTQHGFGHPSNFERVESDKAAK